MPNTGENVRLQLSVNGKVVATSGIDSFGVLHAMVTWVKRDPVKFKSRPRPNPTATLDQWIGNEVRISMGGLNSQLEKHLRWFDRTITVGDEVTVRVLPPGAFDPPIPRRRPNIARPKRKKTKTPKTRHRH